MIIDFPSQKEDDHIKVDENGNWSMTWTVPYQEYNIRYFMDGVEIPINQTWVQLEFNFGE